MGILVDCLQDPNATAAWNAVISGKKKWLLYPPEIRPPGVHGSGDVDAVSVIDWFTRYYVQVVSQRQTAVAAGKGARGPRECTVGPGEMLFIPHGW